VSTGDAELADQLAEETARLAARLGFAIEPYAARGHWVLAAAPVAIVLTRPDDPHVLPTHRSGLLDPELLPFLVDATGRTRHRLALDAERDNPYVIALTLAAFYLGEARRTGILGLGQVAQRDPAVAVVPPERAMQDLNLQPGMTALRIVTPVEDAAGEALTAAVELSWRAAAAG
jgi:hypothetical protein